MSIADKLERKAEELREKGFDEGVDLGKKTTLLRQLESRLGPLPLAVVLRVAAGDEEELGEWAARILTEKTLEGVFGGPIWARMHWFGPKTPCVSIAERLRHEGRVKGELQGRRRMLIGQLEKRFDLFRLPERMRERVLGGTPAELDVWSLRVLDSRTLEEVFRASS